MKKLEAVNVVVSIYYYKGQMKASAPGSLNNQKPGLPWSQEQVTDLTGVTNRISSKHD